MAAVAVLCARRDSVYKSIPGCDVFDVDRDARSFTGGLPVVAHPPCRAWGAFHWRSNHSEAEKALGFLCVDWVRREGGVLEHPGFSKLWCAAGLPLPGSGVRDRFGGWTLPVDQYWFGHRARKRTWLYIVGVSVAGVPELPLVLGDAPCVVESSAVKEFRRPAVSREERERTPVQFAVWLSRLAMRCAPDPMVEVCRFA